MKSSNGLNRYTGFDERKELYKLVQDHITAIINGDEINPIQMSVIEGVETMKVTVTVALPPDGLRDPRWYAYGLQHRAAALASGTVDTVF